MHALLPSKSQKWAAVFGWEPLWLSNRGGTLRTEMALQNVDLTMKKLLSGGTPIFQAQLGWPASLEIIWSEVHEDTELRVDYLAVGKGTKHPYYHGEIQARNDYWMLARMARYRTGIAMRLLVEKRHLRIDGPMPVIAQVCVYLGQPTLNMPSFMTQDGNTLAYKLLDARSLNAELQIQSESINDVILGVVCGEGAEERNIERILKRIRNTERRDRSDAFVRLLALAKLRGVLSLVIERGTEMGIQVDLSEVPFLVEAMERERKIAKAELAIELLEDRFGKGALSDEIVEIVQELNNEEIKQIIRRIDYSDTVKDALGGDAPSAPKGP